MPEKKTDNLDKIRFLRNNPDTFVVDILKHNPWSTPLQIYKSLSKRNARVAVKACHASGKCVPFGEMVMLADGSRVPAVELIGREFEVLTATSNGFKPAYAKAEFNLIEQVVTLVTETGRRITRSPNHPLYCAQKRRESKMGHLIGWQPIADVEPDEYVAVPYTLDAIQPRSNSVSDDEIKILAYMLGGMASQGVGPIVETISEAAYVDFSKSVVRTGGEVAEAPGLMYGSFPFEIEVKPDTFLAKTVIGNNWSYFSDAERASVPPHIFGLTKKQQQLFLSRLFTIGGYIDATDRHRISLWTRSHRLALDVQHMLLVHNVISSVEKIGPVWRVMISTISDCIAFIASCGIFGQEDKCTAAMRWYRRWLSTHEINDAKNVRKMFPPLHPGLMWDRVVSVELDGIEPTVAIEVPETNTFIGDFWEHNTYTSSDAVFWFTCTGGKTITTAPTWPQVEKLLWGEMHRTYGWAKDVLGGEMLNTQYRITDNSYAFGISTDKGVNMQGHHDSGGGVLIIIDEAPGVRLDIWEAIEGIRAGGDVRILALGNPVFSGGPFSDAFDKDSDSWDTYTISAFDTPNFEGVTLEDLLRMSPKELDHNPRPYLVTKRWVYEKWHQWGPDHPNWKSRVLGEFPNTGSANLFSASWISEAEKRVLPDPGHIYFSAGLDIAGAGSDNTALCLRHGPKIKHLEEWGGEDPRREVAETLRFWRQIGILTVYVDSIGIGHYFVKFLEDEGFNVVPINVSSKPIDDLGWYLALDPDEIPSKRFGNLKAQLYWNLREKFQKGEIDGVSEEAARQLKTIRWKEDERNGKIYIESKESMKKRGISSPDLAESIMLAFSEVESTAPAIPLAQSSIRGWGF